MGKDSVDRVETSPILFDHASDYRRINAEAQRRYNEQIEPPYLTWHFAAWSEQLAEPTKDDGRSFIERRRDWINDEVNIFLRALGVENDKDLFELEPAAGIKSAPTANGEILEFVQRDVISLPGLIPNAPSLCLRAELHSEYVAFSFILPLHDGESTRSDKTEDPFRRLSGSAFGKKDRDEIDDLVAEVFQNIIRKDRELEPDYRTRASQYWDKLYDDAWRIALAPIFRSAGGPIRAPGKVFANFRGIVLPRHWLTPAYGKHELDAHIEAWRRFGREEHFIATDLEGRPQTRINQNQLKIDEEQDPPTNPRRWNRVSAGRALEANGALRRAMHWPKGVPPEGRDANERLKRRTVANLVLDGRAMFASSFGAGLKIRGDVEPNEDPATTAGRYCIFYCREPTADARSALERRLDRVVQRLHSLGVRRTIGLKDLDGIWRASHELRKVDRDIQIAMGASRHRRNAAYLDARNLARQLAKIQGSIPGGLDYRISRTGYYARDFTDTLRDLSLDRVEGWEPYHEFARRRLLPQWRNIGQIGERAEAVRNRLDRLIDLANAESTNRLTYGAINVAAFAIGLSVGVGALGALTQALPPVLASLTAGGGAFYAIPPPPRSQPFTMALPW